VNNVGFFEVRKFAEITDQDWTAMFELNVMSGVRLARALFPGCWSETAAASCSLPASRRSSRIRK
jgi:short-subunit dehydrogenase